VSTLIQRIETHKQNVEEEPIELKHSNIDFFLWDIPNRLKKVLGVLSINKNNLSMVFLKKSFFCFFFYMKNNSSMF